jgi:hypothetical protein
MAVSLRALDGSVLEHYLGHSEIVPEEVLETA